MDNKQRDSYRRWRAPELPGRKAVARFVESQSSFESGYGWQATVVASVLLVGTLVVVLQKVPEFAGESAPGYALSPAALALIDVQLPSRPQFSIGTGVSLPGNAPAIPKLNQISLAGMVDKETL